MAKRITTYKNKVIKIQAAYFLLTGAWPIVDLASFLAVTGHKTDIWLVHMVSLLALSIGTCLLIERRSLLLAICVSLSFAVIDILYVMGGTISPIYLVDALIHIVCLFVYSLPDYLEDDESPQLSSDTFEES